MRKKKKRSTDLDAALQTLLARYLRRYQHARAAGRDELAEQLLARREHVIQLQGARARKRREGERVNRRLYAQPSIRDFN